MIRILLYLVAVFLLAAGFVWLADRPGELLITWQGYEVRTSVMVAVVGVAAIIALIALIGAVIRAIWRAPRSVGNFLGARRRDRGYRALSRGMIAIGAGDSRIARRAAHEAQSLLGSREPLVLLLSAQAAQISGEADSARTAFTALSENAETRVLGLHGLFVEARRRGEHAAARHFAEEAMHASPRIGWAGPALFDYQCQASEWAGALATLESNADAGFIDREEARKLRAVLLTARATQEEDGSPDAARGYAIEAHRVAPELVPAAVVAARLLTRHGDVRRAARVLETTWKVSPHPEIAAAYAEVRPGDSARDRMKRMRKLADMRANHPEGAMAIARVAIDVDDWPTAREAIAGLVRGEPTERVCVLMAEIEEGEHNDQPRARAWLTRALTAPRDPAWMADGRVFAEWAPVSPVSGRVGVFEWKVPPDRLPPARPIEIELPPERGDDEIEAPTPPAITAKPVEPAPAPAPPPVDAKAEKPVPPPQPPVPPPAVPVVEKKPEPPPPPAPPAAPPKPMEAKAAEAKLREVVLPRVPDDPGPQRRQDEDERYQLF
jgi:HemY protein